MVLGFAVTPLAACSTEDSAETARQTGLEYAAVVADGDAAAAYDMLCEEFQAKTSIEVMSEALARYDPNDASFVMEGEVRTDVYRGTMIAIGEKSTILIHGDRDFCILPSNFELLD